MPDSRDSNYELCRQMLRGVLTGNIRAEQRALLAQVQAKNKSGCDRACPATDAVLHLVDKISPALMACVASSEHHPAAESLVLPIMDILGKVDRHIER